jgi:hypothetical protein
MKRNFTSIGHCMMRWAMAGAVMTGFTGQVYAMRPSNPTIRVIDRTVSGKVTSVEDNLPCFGSTERK